MTIRHTCMFCGLTSPMEIKEETKEKYIVFCPRCEHCTVVKKNK